MAHHHLRVGMALLLLAGVAACGSSTHAVPRSAKTTGSQSGSAISNTPPPYIAKAVWVTLSSGRSLQVYPTSSGRAATADGAEQEAWHEVLRAAPDAATPGMRAQFDCHWAFARLAEPNKPSWNLEPWRPVVSAQRMYDTRCNPGGPEV